MVRRLNNTEEPISERIYDVFQSSYKIEAKLLGVDDFPPLSRAREDLQKSHTDFWGYWQNDQLAAVVEIEFRNLSLDICSLVVDPAFFRQGIGEKLLRSVIDQYEHKLVEVETGFDNKPAIALYKKLGFEESKIWKTSIGIAKIKLIMERERNTD